MAQQFNDLVYRYPQGQGPRNVGRGRGLLSEPGGLKDLGRNWGGIKIMPDPGFSGGLSGAVNNNQGSPGMRPPHQNMGGQIAGAAQQQPNRFDNRMQGLQQQQTQLQNEINRRGGAENAQGFANQLGQVQGRLGTMQTQQQNMQNPQYQQLANQRSQLENEINRRGGMDKATGFATQFNDISQQMRGMRNAPAPETGGGFIAGNPQQPSYNPPQQAAPQAPSQRDPAAVAARQAQRQQYLQRMGR